MAHIHFNESPHLEDRVDLIHITMMGVEGIPSLVVSRPARGDEAPGFFDSVLRKHDDRARERLARKTLARHGLNDL